jgi:hypothetical protein
MASFKIISDITGEEVIAIGNYGYEKASRKSSLRQADWLFWRRFFTHFSPNSSASHPRFFLLVFSRSLLLHAAPLLEEKWDLGSQALIPNIRDPFLHDRSRTWTRLAADDHPIDLLEIQLPKRTDQRLKRQKFDFCTCFPQVINSKFIFFVSTLCPSRYYQPTPNRDLTQQLVQRVWSALGIDASAPVSSHQRLFR